jgi:pantothenate synthetase
MYPDNPLITLPVVISICAIIISVVSLVLNVRNRRLDKRYELNQRKIDSGLKLAQAIVTGYKLAEQLEELYKLELNEEDKKRVQNIHNQTCIYS